MLNGKQYCRRCISFKGEEVEHKPSYPKKAPIHLEYELSPEQKELSNKLVENYKKGIDSLVYAVCGSGKTEIVMKVISYCISKGKKIGFSIPRRDVVFELGERLKKVFSDNRVTTVVGGHHNKLIGDIICLTTHQLYRYNNYFDLLIIDEVDAFPFKNNKVLGEYFKKSCKGNYIVLTATLSKTEIEKYKNKNYSILRLYTRFHGKPIPVPKIYKLNRVSLFIKLITCIETYIKNGKQVLIFVPTIEICEKLYAFLSIFIKNGSYIHSKRPKRNETITIFKNGKYKYLVTTAVLERGVTFRNVQVIIYMANHSIYDKDSLIQIAGRVGRKADSPYGDVIYLATEVTKDMELSISEIEEANMHLNYE